MAGILKWGLFLIILILCMFFIQKYIESDIYNLKCIISNVNGKTYCVRDREKLEVAADLLATVSDKCSTLVKYVNKKFPNDPNVQILVKNYNPTSFSETLPTSTLKAYSENKGEKLAFCLNKHDKDNGALIDMNTLMFVAIHELSHVMTKSVGHEEKFWKNFKFLLEQSKESKLYTPVNYAKNPQPYCGMKLDGNPYYNN